MPSVFVASIEFVDARRRAVAARSVPTRRACSSPHPIQDRTDDELQALADDAVDEILRAITTETDGGNRRAPTP